MFFLFDNKLYKQCDRLGMGLPQSPVFANIFMSHYEEQWLSNCPSNFKPVIYRRYVDDTFVLFTDKSHAAQFLNYINRQHDNINFTMETESNNSLSFLDVFIKKQGNDFLTSVHRKPTFSGLGLSYFSFFTNNFKYNSILTLLNRTFNKCSNYKLLHDEFQFLISFFKNNGFPVQFIESKINKFLHSKYCNITNNETNNQKLYFSLPFFGHQSEKLKDDLLNLLRQYFPDYSSNIILVNRFTIGSLFRNKDTLNKGMLSAVVYKYVCPACGAQYVGSTTRSLATRAAEHAGISVRTGVPLSQPSQSHIRDHLLTCGGPQIALNHFEIIGTCINNSLELRILESLHIAKIKPSLNCMKSAYPLSLFNYFFFVFFVRVLFYCLTYVKIKMLIMPTELPFSLFCVFYS